MSSKWIKDTNLRIKTIKLLEESTRENLHDTKFEKHQFEKYQHQKKKIDWASSKLYNFIHQWTSRE